MSNLHFNLRRFCFFAVGFLAALAPPQSIVHGQEPAENSAADTSSAAGAAVRSIFSPSAAPERKTMGLMQRSFLDLADSSKNEIEIALVIDGTSSMATEIDGVKDSIHMMLKDLRLHRSNVSMAIVVYRDTESPSGPTSVLLSEFSNDDQRIAESLAKLVPESGTPFFNEMSDKGVWDAIEKLPWTSGQDTTRWIFLFGDAPPYAESFENATLPQAKRTISTSMLSELAAAKDIQIHCVLCKSSTELESVYDAATPETRLFMNSLASATGGVMLDLSYADISKVVLDSGTKPRVDYVKISPITESELIAVRKPSNDSSANPVTKEVRIAVLPHMPLGEIHFDPKNEAVQVATALRHKFQNLAGIRVTSPIDVERQFRRLLAQGLSDQLLIQGLAARLRVDYVVWGDATDTKTSTFYAADTGKAATTAMISGDNGIQLASTFLTTPTTDAKLTTMQKSVNPKMLPYVEQRLAKDPATESEILAALEALEQALGYLAGSPESKSLLDTAEKSCLAALKVEPNNALAQWLHANVSFNLAQAHMSTGDILAAKAATTMMVKELQRANRNKNRKDIDSPSLILELQADYILMAEGNTASAIDAYQKLANSTQVCSSVRRRAHWALTGIYCGDWQADKPNDKKVVDPELARQHAIAILANWPESPEASLLKQWLRWDPESKKSEFAYLPKPNEQLGAFAVAAR